jgi:hypothetical protein
MPAPSILEGLLARREELVAEQVRDLPVPLWDRPSMTLRVKVVDHDMIFRQLQKIEKSQVGARSEAMLNAHAAILSAAVTEVLLGEGDEQATVTLPDLVEPLGLSEKASGAQVLRAALLRDADVLTLAGAVMRHSGYTDDEVEDKLAGE